MARGTFANIRLFNKFLNKQAPQTVHLPSGETVSPPHTSARLLGTWNVSPCVSACVSPRSWTCLTPRTDTSSPDFLC